jgi:hypothetical protein
VEFSEANGAWQRVPEWAEFLVRFGFAWCDSKPAVRRIAIVSMPCDSAAAGLVALGAMRKRLELDDANDSISHLQRIEGLVSRGSGQTFLRHRRLKGRFLVERVDAKGMLWVRQEPSKTALRTVILPSQSSDWRFDGEAPPRAEGEDVPYRQFYSELVEGAGAIVISNLAKSDSGICLTGRVLGESASQEILAAIRFKITDRTADLSQLLTLQHWSPGSISRVTFFNARTGQLDRGTGSPGLVVTDGDAAFLKVVEASDFQQSDVIAITHRAVERDRLEAIGVKIADLSQWYVLDTELLDRLRSVPQGIAVSALKRR